MLHYKKMKNSNLLLDFGQIASAMESVLFHGEDPKDKVKELMTRDFKKEKAY